LNEAGSEEGRYNGADEPSPPPDERRRLPSPILVELLERRARASASAEDIVAGLLQEETQTRNRALRAENEALQEHNDNLRACVGHFLGSDVVATFRDSPVLLLSTSIDARAAQQQREEAAERSLERERESREEADSLARNAETSMRNAQRAVERLEGVVARNRAEATVAEGELRTERTRRQEVMDQRDYLQVSLESALGALDAERAGRVNAGEALLIAENDQQYYRRSLTSALNGLRRERAGRETAEDLQRYYRQSLTSAIRGLMRERAGRFSQVASLTAAVTTAEQALTAERARREDAEDAVKCVICLVNRRTRVLRPCMHLVLCDSCPRVTECPICRARVRSRVSVVLS